MLNLFNGSIFFGSNDPRDFLGHFDLRVAGGSDSWNRFKSNVQKTKTKENIFKFEISFLMFVLHQQGKKNNKI